MFNNFQTNKIITISIVAVIIVALVLIFTSYQYGLKKGLNAKQSILNKYSSDQSNDSKNIMNKKNTNDNGQTTNPLINPPFRTIIPDRIQTKTD